jgi:nucleoside-diphosphate-sugar epimerase
MARRILVTGSTGLLGSRLLQLKTTIEFVPLPSEIDLLQKSGLSKLLNFAEEKNVEGVLHLAWTSNKNSGYQQERANYDWYEFTIGLVESCLEKRLNFFGVSTCLDELTGPQSHYIDSKRKLIQTLSAEIMTEKIGMFRPFYVVDEVLKRPGIYRDLFKSDFVLNSSSQCNDYIHSVDVASGIIVSIMADLGGSIDLGSGRLRSNKALVVAICKNERIKTCIN